MPKIGILGDLHLRATSPINRIDNYYETQFRKLEQVFECFKKNKCDCILQPGDFFNAYGRDPYGLVFDVISLINRYGIPIYCVLGQHDIKFHNLSSNDLPIKILINAGLIVQLGKQAPTIGNVDLYGANWNEELPDIRDEAAINILVTHRMIINNEKLWKGQTEYTTSTSLQKKNDFDLYVCGDNHQAFINGKVINCGSMGRMSIDQADHIPMFCIYDSDTREITKYKYEIESSDKVLKMEDFLSENFSKDRKNAFVQGLNSDFEAEINFKSNIELVLKQRRRTKQRTKELIQEALSGQPERV